MPTCEWRIAYQRISFDWDVADGTYTPQQLRQARMRVCRWGPERTYTLVMSEQGMSYLGDIPLEFKHRAWRD